MYFFFLRRQAFLAKPMDVSASCAPQISTSSTHLLLSELEHMQRKSASRCQVWQMPLTSVVVLHLFICCIGDNKRKREVKRRQAAKRGIKKQKTRRVGVWTKWDPSTLHKMQRLASVEPSVPHLSKIMEENRERRESKESHFNHITCLAYNIQRFVRYSTGTSRLLEQTFQKVA